jgi:radical SAM protein with 4Fe4S-binding SPASM domain
MKKIKTQKVSIPANILSKTTVVDTEQVLQESLSRKHGKKYIEYRKRYNSIVNDHEHNTDFDYPTTVVLELLNRCNLECIMCYQGYRNDAVKNTINDVLIDKIFEDFSENKLQALMLSISEPLLYKDIARVLDRARQAEIMDLFLFTNGSLLTEEKSKIILESSVTRLFISIDAATQETYDIVRVPVKEKANKLDVLEENIKRFMTLRSKLNKSIPLVRVSFVALKQNRHEIDDFINKWRGVVDSVEIQRETSIELYEDMEKDVDYKGKKNSDILRKYNCNKPWGEIAIYSDGTVGPCCNPVGRNIVIGNVKDSTINEIWNGKKMKKIRDGFVNNNPVDVCKICLDNQKNNM